MSGADVLRGPDFRDERAMADADLEDGIAGASRRTRKCTDCGKALADDLRYCPSCGRFVPGSKRPLPGIATGACGALLPPLICLMIAGYIWLPILGLLAEAALWGYVFLTGDLRVSMKRILWGTGIGLALVAVVAIVMRICGVGG
ncbi:MAG: hypothetical protein ACYS9X_00995 [Planctomycetota bacterium]|jgi:hypothetical protein